MCLTASENAQLKISRIEKQMDRLQEILDYKRGKIDKNLNWGDVGDLGRISQLFEEMIDGFNIPTKL